jgi:hypothetical protein
VTPLVAALRARAGTTLGDSVGVRVTDTLGRTMAGVPVRWEAEQGAAQAVGGRTDSLGVASARWVLGGSTGTQRLRAIVGGPDSRIAPVTLSAVATAGPAARLVLAAGDRQRGATGATLSRPIVVRIVDEAGNPAAGTTVSVAPSAGSVRDSSLVSDANGAVTVPWTMGRSAGAATLTLRVDGIEHPVQVRAMAMPGAPANLTFDDAPAGAGRRAGVKHLLAVVADVYGNPVPETQVSFHARSGTVAPARGVTDAHGRIAIAWTAGARAGDQQLSAAVRGSSVTGRFQMGHVEQAGAERPLPKPKKRAR